MRIRIPETWGERSGWVLAAFLIGVAIRSVDPLHSWRDLGIALPFALMAGFLTLVAYFAHGQKRFVTCCLLAVCLGLWRFEMTIPIREEGILPWIGRSATVQGEVSQVERAPFGTTAVIDVASVADRPVQGPGNTLRIVLARASTAKPGDRVNIACTFTVPLPTDKSPRRQLISARQGVWANCGRMKILATHIGSIFHPLAILHMWRTALNARIDASMPFDEASLLKGILYGERSMSPDLQEAFRSAGLMHIIAVSGSNVSILSSMIFAVVLGLGMHRRQAFRIMSVVLVVFVGFVGFSASVLRAACMGWLALYGREVGRLVSTRRLLFVAAALLCLWDPWQLAYDAGFALSFLATFALLEGVPRLELVVKHLPKAFGIRESVATTFAVTCLTAPYSAWVFGRMSLAGLFTNVIALPLVPWAMLFGACSAIIGRMDVFSFLQWPARGALQLLILIGHWSQTLTWLDIRL